MQKHEAMSLHDEFTNQSSASAINNNEIKPCKSTKLNPQSASKSAHMKELGSLAPNFFFSVVLLLVRVYVCGGGPQTPLFGDVKQIAAIYILGRSTTNLQFWTRKIWLNAQRAYKIAHTITYPNGTKIKRTGS